MLEEDFSIYNGINTNLRKAQLRLLDMLLEFDRICKKHNIKYFLSGGTCLGAIRHGGFIPWDDDIDIDVWHTDYEKLVEIVPRELNEKFIMQTSGNDPSFTRGYMRIVDTGTVVDYEDNSVRDHYVFKGLWLDILPVKKCSSYRIKKLLDHVYSGSWTNATIKRGARWKYYISCAIFPVAKLIVKLTNIFDEYYSSDNKISHDYGTSMAPKLTKSDCFPVGKISFEGYEFYGPHDPHKYLVGLYGENYMTIPSKENRQVHAQQINFID